ncbi:hypothetical protein QYE76_048827 [Lolium multiflorum]|uniref:Uncharacterized protein n=1 Tax=Lolium multiflorum TaxID=4521 RepID=A0AAD8WHN8_LOLMU|nr:hypothetical protein QYE76_048827 [Lolium multiflorum]
MAVESQGFSDAVKPAKMDAEDFAKMQIKAARTIRLSLADQVLYHVIDVESPSEIWTTDGPTEHVNAFNRVVSDLARIEDKVEDEDMALLMLTSLPKSYKGLVVTLTYGKTIITSSEVQTSLLSYDQREKTTAEEAAAGASDGQG